MGRYDVDSEETTHTKHTSWNDLKKTRSEVRKEPEKMTDDTPAEPRVIKVRRGWGAAERLMNSNAAYAQRLTISQEPVIIKFLEDDPYAVFHQHWIERQGQKSFTCIADIDPKGCPLCDAGDRPRARFNFNVALLDPGVEPIIRSYEVGTRVVDQLKNFATDPRQGPLTKHYWAVSRTGKGATTATAHQLVRERDLEEYDIEAITEDQFSALQRQAYDNSIVPVPSRETLMEIALEDLSD
jgi:hypothetical protein